eukprot:6208585-Pleurochrysis_carterae.AAC.1
MPSYEILESKCQTIGLERGVEGIWASRGKRQLPGGHRSDAHSATASYNSFLDDFDIHGPRLNLRESPTDLLCDARLTSTTRGQVEALAWLRSRDAFLHAVSHAFGLSSPVCAWSGPASSRPLALPTPLARFLFGRALTPLHSPSSAFAVASPRLPQMLGSFPSLPALPPPPPTHDVPPNASLQSLPPS